MGTKCMFYCCLWTMVEPALATQSILASFRERSTVIQHHRFLVPKNCTRHAQWHKACAFFPSFLVSEYCMTRFLPCNWLTGLGGALHSGRHRLDHAAQACWLRRSGRTVLHRVGNGPRRALALAGLGIAQVWGEHAIQLIRKVLACNLPKRKRL